jgi:hypothetical protein
MLKNKNMVFVRKKMNKYNNLFHWNLQDGSSISAEAIIFLHDYVMLFLIVIIVVIMVLLVKVMNNYSYSSLLLIKPSAKKSIYKKFFFLLKILNLKRKIK